MRSSSSSSSTLQPPNCFPPFNAPSLTAAAGCVCCRPVQAQCAPKVMQLIHKSVPTKPKLKSPPIVRTHTVPKGEGSDNNKCELDVDVDDVCHCPYSPSSLSPLLHCLPVSLWVCVSEWDGHSNSSSIGLDARLGGARNKSPGGGTMGKWWGGGSAGDGMGKVRSWI